MPCKFANQIAPVISKHSIWLKNNKYCAKKVHLDSRHYTVVNQRNVCCTYLWVHLARWHAELDKRRQIYPIWALNLRTGHWSYSSCSWSYSIIVACPGSFTRHCCHVLHHLMSAKCSLKGVRVSLHSCQVILYLKLLPEKTYQSPFKCFIWCDDWGPWINFSLRSLSFYPSGFQILLFSFRLF